MAEIAAVSARNMRLPKEIGKKSRSINILYSDLEKPPSGPNVKIQGGVIAGHRRWDEDLAPSQQNKRVWTLKSASIAAQASSRDIMGRILGKKPPLHCLRACLAISCHLSYLACRWAGANGL